MKRLQTLIVQKPFTVLLSVFLLSLLIRIVNLGSLPFNFHEDEVLVGYIGRFILENGMDIYGNKWPLLYFNKFGDYYIIGPMYLSGLSTLLFGVNEFAVRFPAAFLGSLIVFPVYYLSKWIYDNTKIALLAAFFVAISPWHIILSRSSVEGIIGSTIFLTGIVVVLQSVQSRNIKHLIIASLLFLFSYWIYHPFRIYAPLSFLPLFILFFPTIRKSKRYVLSLIITTIFFFGLTFYISTTPWGSGRLEQTSIFSPLSGVEIKIQEQIYNAGEQSRFVTRMFNNKLIGYSREFISQYVTYFSPNYLFIKGGAESRYDMPSHGLLYLTYLIALIVIFLPFGKKISVMQQKRYYFLFLMLLAPLPAAITYFGSPNIHRSVLLGILLTIPAAYGFYKLVTSKYRTFILPVIGLVLLGEVLYFWHQYSVQSEVYNAIRRNDAHRTLVQYIQENKEQYQNIYIPVEGNLPLYYLYFNNDFSPEYARQFQSDARIDRIDNIVFVDASCPTTVTDLNYDASLIINRHNCEESPEGFKEVTTIKGKNPLLEFTIYAKN